MVEESGDERKVWEQRLKMAEKKMRDAQQQMMEAMKRRDYLENEVTPSR